MKGYKAFESDWTCRGFQFEMGKTYEEEGEPIICQKGFHFCANPIDVFGYYPMDDKTKIAEVEALGEIRQEGTKFCTNKIRIIKEFTMKQLQALIRDGNNNTGENNTGDRNSGHCNSGNWNSGSWNSGHWNSGDSNSGSRNSGNRNSGNWNSGSWNSGYFNSNTPTVRLFNHYTDMTYDEFWSACPTNLFYHISDKKMDADDVAFVRGLPHFDADIFEKCTGIRLEPYNADQHTSNTLDALEKHCPEEDGCLYGWNSSECQKCTIRPRKGDEA